ncbi:MAG: ribosome hibernation-promoting factor, HPF/YfiA family [Acetivibrionales bacterium]|jgi:putative sigma-54 modulation protein
MKFIISGKNFDVTDSLKERVAKKLGKLEKFFNAETEAHVRMSIQRNRPILEVTIPTNGIILRAEVSGDDMYSCIDKAEDILERQIRKHKTRLEKRLHTGVFKPEYFSKDIDVEEETDFKVVRTKKFDVKPMPVEEAILQMNLLGHEFFVFSNAVTNQVNVVYKRKDGNYGLIEPED